MFDYNNLIEKNYVYDYVATTFSVYKRQYFPDKRFVNKLIKAGCKNVIAEGNYFSRADVKEVLEYGAYAVCIGSAISNVYKLTRRYTVIET